MIEFKPWPKTPRLYRDVVITEKIDGTNAAVHIVALDDEETCPDVAAEVEDTETGTRYAVAAQSRNRLITPGDDNYGFAAFAHEFALDLVRDLGPGTHYGEWWGNGIQRGYGLSKGDRRFSLFNVARFGHLGEARSDRRIGTVPILYAGVFADWAVSASLSYLRDHGSDAVIGYGNPEGIVVYHEAARQVFKVLLEADDRPKSAAA